MALTVLGYGSVPAILALAIVLVPRLFSVINPAIVSDPYKYSALS